MDLVWHYAPWEYLPEMVLQGVLRASNAGAGDELPMLWFLQISNGSRQQQSSFILTAAWFA